MNFSRTLMFLFSICLHGGVAGTLFFFSGAGAPSEERVYHVSLAEFAPQGAALPAALEQSAETSPPEAPQEPSPPQPSPAPVSPDTPNVPLIEPDAKKISAKKKNEVPKARKEKSEPAAPQAAPAVQPQAGAQTQGVPGPQPRMVGGLSAYKSDHVDERPSISRRAAPEYPMKARRMQIEGKVMIELVVDTGGKPTACKIQSADPPGYFEESALTAANKMRFIPGKIKGQPVNTLVLLPFNFQLR